MLIWGLFFYFFVHNSALRPIIEPKSAKFGNIIRIMSWEGLERNTLGMSKISISQKPFNSRKGRWKKIKLLNKVRYFFMALKNVWETLWGRFFARSSVYVLECEGGKYYIGSTSRRGIRRKERFAEHMSRRGGSAWTRKHKPIRLAEEVLVPPQYMLGVENSVMARYLLEKGLNNVRGGMLSDPRDFDHSDVRMLTSVLGHYLNLDYEYLTLSLKEALPRVPLRTKRKQQESTSHSNRVVGNRGGKGTAGKRSKGRSPKPDDQCFHCGEIGHWAAHCPNKEKGQL